MVGLDVNANPQQYRVWVVNNVPDFTGEFYTGEKSGNAPFVDVVPYVITDDSIIGDFLLPLPSRWRPNQPEILTDFPLLATLPVPIEDSAFAIIDGYAYLFGGKLTSHIYRASLNNPQSWIDTGATLPTNLYGSSFAIVGSELYLFGGDDGYNGPGLGPLNTAYSASMANPTSWSSLGSVLPRHLLWSSLGISNGQLYMFGGLESAGATSHILTASVSSPTSWSIVGNIATPVYGASLAQIDGYWYLYGGMTSPNAPSIVIQSAPVSSPTTWTVSSVALPYATAFNQFLTMGNDGYMIGSTMVGSSSEGFSTILQCHLSSPTEWFDTQLVVPGNISHSSVAIIYDRVWLFGGSGSSAIFACNRTIKYGFYDSVAQAYGNITRVLLPATNNANNPSLALGFNYWHTDYLSD
jgi:hypothetical protein